MTPAIPHIISDNGSGTIVEAVQKKRIKAFVSVNNRLEGNAPSTIEAVVNGLGS